MGKITPHSQVGQDGSPSKTTLLEIIYGGTESPFGGIDSSASPAYIDPRCFAASDGFIIVDNKLCVANWQQLALPTLFGGVSNVRLLKIGTFYSSKYGQLNYVLGVHTDIAVGPPAAKFYTFYLTTWIFDAGVPTLNSNDSQIVKLYDTLINAVPATLTVYLTPGESSTFTDSGVVGLELVNNGTLFSVVTIAYAPGDTIGSLIPGLVTAFNAAWSSLVTATATSDGTGITFTAVTPGIAGNLLGVGDQSQSGVSGDPPAFYFPSSAGDLAMFQNGANSFITSFPTLPINISVAYVGGTAYFANLGPFILKFSGPGTLTISTMYSGVQVIRKFSGSLIGIGQVPPLNTIEPNTNMIFSWSAALDLDVWAPENTSGNVTGAGFAQLADIADYLVGLVVSNNTAFIIRSQGISYATSLSSGTDPFQFAHIGLGDKGEGAQNPALVCQYDQTGAYVGNADIFQVSGSISAIGMKIKAQLFNLLNNSSLQLGSAASAIQLAQDTFPVIIFVIGTTVFLYNTTNQTWMVFTWTDNLVANTLSVDVISISNFNSTQTVLFAPVIAYQENFASAVTALVLTEGIANDNSLSNVAIVTFPQEEIVFGRDVTIDALYISFFAALGHDCIVEIYINGTQPVVNSNGITTWEPTSILFASVPLSATDFPSLTELPYELQVFPTNTNGTGVFTVHSPQLQIKVLNLIANSSTDILRFTKIMMRASVDPDQVPV